MSQQKEKTTDCNPAKKQGKNLSMVHSIIGIGIMVLFFFLPPIDPITPVGMKCVGAFLGMIYLWSTVDTLWPSILGLVMLGISGYDAGGLNGVFLNAIGNWTVLLILFAFILFGGVMETGATNYIAKWFLTKKIFKGRPFVFLAIFFACCGVMSSLVSPITALIILWPVTLGITSAIGLERCDKAWSWLYVGMFLVMTLMQPLLPFFGAQLVPISAFQGMTAAMGTPMSFPFGKYMIVCFTMTFLVMVVYLLIMKLLRVDVSKLKAIDPDMIASSMSLPPMNKVQKIYLLLIPTYLAFVLVPGFLPSNPISTFLSSSLGTLGITVVFVVAFMLIKVDGKPLLDFKEMAYRQMNWGIFFMIASAVYAANTMSDASTGVTDFLIQVLNPILGGQSELGFVAIMYTVALIITNFANNAAMAVVLMPVVLSFSAQLGIHPLPVAMGVILMVFVAMLTPAASPHAGMMHGRKDIYSTGEIMKIGLSMCIVTLLLYIFIGYPLMKFILL